MLSFEERISSSTILSSLDSKYLIKLSLYLDPVLQSPGRSRFVRCWHAKTDGWAASTFHSNCDGKGPTVTIIQVGSYIFGGYTDKSWGGMYQFITALFAQTGRWISPFSKIFGCVLTRPKTSVFLAQKRLFMRERKAWQKRRKKTPFSENNTRYE